MSRYWVDDQGCVNWLLPNGDVRRAPPKNFGVIRNGHLIQLSQNTGEETVWDAEFESEFQRADDAFPDLIDWLHSLDRPHRAPDDFGARFCEHKVPDAQLATITECLVSLAIRSPMNRAAAVSLAEKMRGALPDRERNALIGANMRGTQRRVVNAIGAQAKFAVMFSPARELIFGDGFFHNIRSPANAVLSPQILAPLTPTVAVALTRPTMFTSDPPLVTTVLSSADTEALNDAVQVYACEALFFRSEAPVIRDDFRRRKHLEYSDPDNPIDGFLRMLPGIPPRDRTLDHRLYRGSQ